MTSDDSTDANDNGIISATWARDPALIAQLQQHPYLRFDTPVPIYPLMLAGSYVFFRLRTMKTMPKR